MKPRQSGWRRVVSINLCFLGAVCSASLARLILPGATGWWQMGVYSFVFGVAAILLVIGGLKGVWKLLLHDVGQSGFFGQGREARSDTFADDRGMRKEDMIR